MAKPRIGLDFDGVLADFGGHAVAEINRRLGTAYTTDDITTWDHAACLGAAANEVTRDLIREATCYGQLLPLPGAVEGVSRLAQVYDLWGLTSIPLKALSARRRWVVEHGFPRQLADQVLVVSAEQKAAVAAFGGLVAVVEDKDTTAAEVADVGIASYLVDCPYNRGPVPPGVLRGTFAQIVDWLVLASDGWPWDARGHAV